MYLYIPLHTYDYPFIDDFPTFLPYPNHSKPGQCPCVANQIPSGFSSVRYGQWLIFRWFMMMYRLNKEMLAFQFATLKNQRAYPHPPMISAWARLQVSLSCEDFHERKNTMLIILYIFMYIIHVYVRMIMYDYVYINLECFLKSWTSFWTWLRHVCRFFIQFRPEEMSDNYWCKSWIVNPTSGIFRKHMGTPMRLAMVASYTRGSHGTCT